jgi:hypothetical protein
MKIDDLQRLRDVATPLPWTADFLGGRELADQGVLRDVESVSSPFCRAEHKDDEAFAVAAVNALPALISLARAAHRVVVNQREQDEYVDHGPTDPERQYRLHEEAARSMDALRAALVALG